VSDVSVRPIVQRHGGFMRKANGADGEGATCCFTLGAKEIA